MLKLTCSLLTRMCLRLPEGVYCRIARRSSLAFNHIIEAGRGVIDPDHAGEIQVILANKGENDTTIRAGYRIAQIIFENTHIVRSRLIELKTEKTIDSVQQLTSPILGEKLGKRKHEDDSETRVTMIQMILTAVFFLVFDRKKLTEKSVVAVSL